MKGHILGGIIIKLYKHLIVSNDFYFQVAFVYYFVIIMQGNTYKLMGLTVAIILAKRIYKKYLDKEYDSEMVEHRIGTSAYFWIMLFAIGSIFFYRDYVALAGVIICIIIWLISIYKIKVKKQVLYYANYDYIIVTALIVILFVFPESLYL